MVINTFTALLLVNQDVPACITKLITQRKTFDASGQKGFVAGHVMDFIDWCWKPIGVYFNVLVYIRTIFESNSHEIWMNRNALLDWGAL